MSKNCWNCIHCDVCANIDGFSHHVSDVSKCKHFKGKADVEPVKHGERVYGEFDIPHCSECGNEIMPHLVSNYCPNCGAKMDGKEVHK